MSRAAAGAGGSIDQYALYDNVSLGEAGYNTEGGRTSATPAIVGGEKTGVFILLGQSLAANNGVSNFTPTNPTKCHQINPYTGNCFRLIDPALGPSGGAGSIVGRIADKLIVDGVFQRVIMIPAAIAGTGVYRWASGGDHRHRLEVCVKRARQNSYLSHQYCAVLWMQGEYDNQQNTTQADYTSMLLDVIDISRRFGNASLPWFIAKETYVSGNTDANVQAAQLAIVNPSNFIYAGPNIDSLTGANRQGDDVHLSDAGNAAAAALWSTAIDAVF